MNRRIGQIAIVASDQHRSTDFYATVLGMDHIFGTRAFRDETAEKIQGIKNIASSTRWLIDDRELFQLEIFQFEHPQSRPLPKDHDISDVGYNRVVIAVKSLEETSQKATAAGGVVTTLPYGDQTSHAVIKDPDGVLLELVEAPELVPGARPARIIGLGMTTNDIDTTIKDMCDGFGFTPREDLFQQKTYWQGDGRLEQHQTLQLDDMYLLVSQYRDSRPRRADYQLCDMGIMNFAVCFPDQTDFQSCYQLTQQMGMSTNSEPLIIGNDASVAYNNDRQGFSVEMIFMASKLWGLYGFTPPRVLDRVINKFLEWKAQRSHKKRLSINTK
jgi:catechol 2,3-dioxygenase-like lactoylglutathione lyase family enzyme